MDPKRLTTADARSVELHSTDTGRSRLMVTGDDDAIIGVVHVRDAAKATSRGNTTTTARHLPTVRSAASRRGTPANAWAPYSTAAEPAPDGYCRGSALGSSRVPTSPAAPAAHVDGRSVR
jgi:hypothetical protein